MAAVLGTMTRLWYARCLDRWRMVWSCGEEKLSWSSGGGMGWGHRWRKELTFPSEELLSGICFRAGNIFPGRHTAKFRRVTQRKTRVHPAISWHCQGKEVLLHSSRLPFPVDWTYYSVPWCFWQQDVCSRAWVSHQLWVGKSTNWIYPSGDVHPEFGAISEWTPWNEAHFRYILDQMRQEFRDVETP